MKKFHTYLRFQAFNPDKNTGVFKTENLYRYLPTYISTLAYRGLVLLVTGFLQTNDDSGSGKLNIGIRTVTTSRCANHLSASFSPVS